MRHLIIRNFGPVHEADIQLGAVNVIIGMQSSGKSCVLKTTCYCAWVEKRLQLAQKPNGFGKGSGFMDLLADYYKMGGYVRPDTYIEYETDHVRFSYDHAKQLFNYEWKTDRWNWRRPKVSHVPADRNLVAAIPGWSSLSLDGNMIEFMSDWDRARRFLKREENILGTGITYEYNEASNTDIVITPTGQRLDLTSSSSGLQSLIPQFVHLDYIFNGQYRDSRKYISYEKKQEQDSLLSLIKDEGTYHRFITTDHSDIFLEEPEQNLFPPTQFQLMDWILEMMANPLHRNTLFIATHSPYVLGHVLQENLKDFSLMLTYPLPEEGMFSVKMASDEDIQGIYDNGSDAFFNFEPHSHVHPSRWQAFPFHGKASHGQVHP